MNYIFVNPISYNLNFAPLIGVPELMGVLQAEQINTEYVDLNLKYLNGILHEKELHLYIKFLDSSIINKTYLNFPKFKEKYIPIRQSFYQVAKRVDFCSYILKHDFFFYSPFLCSYTDKILSYVVDSLGLICDCVLEYIIPDAHSYRSTCENPCFKFNIDKLIEFFESDFNPLKGYYENEVENLLSKKPDCIGITISVASQIISGLYLSYLLKQKSNVHINIGGSFFNDYHKLIINLKDLFGVFFDTISINNNTLTVLKLSKYLEDKIDINDVDNLIFLQNNKVIVNPLKEKNNYDEVPFQVFNGYSMNEYLSPNLVLPIRATISCYWGKCIFCFCSSQTSYQIRPIENVVAEIKHLSEKYNTSFFYFWDNSLPPDYLNKLADELLTKKIKIYYSVYARFEKGFSKSLLKKLKKSGCLKILWGLDSASPNVLRFVNKGIDINSVSEILKNSYNAGISNTVHLILGHPSENISDLELDYSFVHKNKKYFDLLNIGYQLYYFEGAVITKDRDKYKNLIKIEEKDRIKYRDKMLNDVKWAKHDIYSVGIYNILYLKKFGSRLFRILHLFNLYIKTNEILFISFIKFYLKIYRFLCDISSKNKEKS